MFDLENKDKSTYQGANDFYSYATSLALIRKNLHSYGLSEHTAKTYELIGQVNRAIEMLLKTVLE